MSGQNCCKVYLPTSSLLAGLVIYALNVVPWNQWVYPLGILYWCCFQTISFFVKAQIKAQAYGISAAAPSLGSILKHQIKHNSKLRSSIFWKRICLSDCSQEKRKPRFYLPICSLAGDAHGQELSKTFGVFKIKSSYLMGLRWTTALLCSLQKSPRRSKKTCKISSPFDILISFHPSFLRLSKRETEEGT